MSEFSYEIIKNLIVLSGDRREWNKELNIVKWGENKPKFDIRSWGERHKKMSKGITLSDQELVKVIRLIEDNRTELNTTNRGLVVGDSKYGCEIIMECGVISTGDKGWSKEVNIIRWSGGSPCFDLRSWGPNRERIGKGITLDKEETKALLKGMATFKENSGMAEKDNGEVSNQALIDILSPEIFI